MKRFFRGKNVFWSLSFIVLASGIFSITCCLSYSEGTYFEITDRKEGAGEDSFKLSPVFKKSIVDRSGVLLAGDCFSNNLSKVLRRYPCGSLAAHVIGFNSPQGKGIEGVEFQYDSVLRKQVFKNHENFYLTIAKDIQYRVEKDLARQTKRLEAETGCTVVMNVKNGQILAMAATPSWNPATVWERNLTNFKNPALQDNVDPWMLFPLLTFFNESVETINPDEQKLILDKTWSWSDIGETKALWSKWDGGSLSEYKLPDRAVQNCSRLGFGQITGIDLPGEKQGNLPPVLPEIFGYDSIVPFYATPLQLLRAFASILNRGEVVKPHVAFASQRLQEKLKINYDGENLKKRSVSKDLLLSERNNKLLEREVVYSKGDLNEKVLHIPGSDSGPALAGIKLLNGSGAEKFLAQVIGMGFWPLKDPYICYITVLNNVKQDPRIRRGTLGSTVYIAKKAASILSDPVERVEFLGDDLLRTDYNNMLETRTMPDLKGVSMRMAVEILFRMGLKVSASGRGRVVYQHPFAGADVSKVESCTIKCVSRSI